MTPPASRRWLFYCLLALLMFGVWGIVSKAATRVASDATILVISTLGVLPAGLILLFSKELKQNLKRAKEHGGTFLLGCAYAFGAGVCGSVGNLMMLQSLAIGGDTSVVLPVTGMFPLATVLLAVVLLKERLHPVQVVGIVFALAALYLFNAADPASSRAGGFWASLGASWMRPALVALVLWGLAGVLQKLATDRISPELSTLCFTLAFIPVAVVVAAMFPVQWQLPSPQAWLVVLLFGAFIGFGTLILFVAYCDGKASVVTPIYALYPAVTVLLAVPIFREKVDLWRGLGIGFAVIAALALSYETPDGKPAAETGSHP